MKIMIFHKSCVTFVLSVQCSKQVCRLRVISQGRNDRKGQRNWAKCNQSSNISPPRPLSRTQNRHSQTESWKSCQVSIQLDGNFSFYRYTAPLWLKMQNAVMAKIQATAWNNTSIRARWNTFARGANTANLTQWKSKYFALVDFRRRANVQIFEILIVVHQRRSNVKRPHSSHVTLLFLLFISLTPTLELRDFFSKEWGQYEIFEKSISFFSLKW